MSLHLEKLNAFLTGPPPGHRRMALGGLLIGLICSAAACSTVTLTRKGEDPLRTEASYTRSFDFFLFGLIGPHAEVNVREACGKQEAVQLQSLHTLSDRLLMFGTFLLYTPRTAKVWCK